MAYAIAQARRRPNETVHDFQHRLVAERKARYDDAPKRSGLDKLRRQEMAKDAWWTLTGHLRGEHAVKTSFLGKTWDEVDAQHTAIHESEG